MTSNEYVTGLAEIMGVERTELATVDRALAKRGFRQIARGKFRPDITLREGLQIALVWAGAEKLTEAADEVERLTMHQVASIEPTIQTSDDFFSLFGCSAQELSRAKFLDVMIRVTRSIGLRKFDASKVDVSLTKNGGVDLKYLSRQKRLSLRFLDLNPISLSGRPNVQTTVTIAGKVFNWIYDVTEGA